MKKLCTFTGCRTVVSDGCRCDKHQHKNKRRAEVIERSAFYNTSSWVNLSRRIRAERPVCERCNNNLTSDLDHWLERSIPGAERYEFDPRNLVCLCKSCHYRKGTELKRLILNEDYHNIYFKLRQEHPRQDESYYLDEWRMAQIESAKKS